MTKIAPSLLSADFSCLSDEIKRIEHTADMLHLDVMDGHFVNNITFGPVVVSAIREKSRLLFDVHLMITNPSRIIPEFIKTGADIITIHAECQDELLPTIRMIKNAGIKAGISINPPTPLNIVAPLIQEIDLLLIMSVNPGWSGQGFIQEVLPKIREAKGLLKRDNPAAELEVDGGINLETGKQAIEAGADILVAGSFVFNSIDPGKAIEDLRCAGTVTCSCHSN
ncbi:ribulose-phosphate 3-epimerase [bacterium]|nr:ribulose-phosphate 3-epimerase [bacterium]MBU1754057.1 ribulose-phosphate 3-epimerase [bacterium]